MLASKSGAARLRAGTLTSHPIAIRTAIFAVITMLSMACFDRERPIESVGSPAAAVPTAAATRAEAAAPQLGHSQVGTPPTTSLPTVDAVVEAVESHDRETLMRLTSFRRLPCTRELGEGGPPRCADDEAEGTDVEVFEFYTCAVEWQRAETISAALAEAALIAPIRRYAAFEPPADYLLAGPGAVVLFEGPDPRVGDGSARRGMAVRVEDGRIEAIWLACGAGNGAASMIPSGQVDFLLPPPS